MIMMSQSYCEGHGQTRTWNYPREKFCLLENNEIQVGKVPMGGRNLAAVCMWVMILSTSGVGGRL